MALSICYFGKERSLDEARALFLSARFSEALTALGRNGSPESVLLRARCLLRRGDPGSAFEVLQRAGPFEGRDVRAGEHHLLLGRSLDRIGRRDDALAHFAAAEQVASHIGGALAAELAFARGDAAHRAHDERAAQRFVRAGRKVQPIDGDPHTLPFAVVRAQLLELSGATAATESEYGRQAALLVEAWSALAGAEDGERDVWVQASVLQRLAPLVCDLHLVDEANLLWHAESTVAWTADVAGARYVVNRALAWNAALEGNHLAAFARFRECAELAPTIPWRIASTLDRAFLASEMRQDVILHEEMLRASTFARSVAWDSVVGEEATVLLEIAEAHARDDGELARHWLSRYKPERNPTDDAPSVGSADRRQQAIEQDAHGAVFAAEGFVPDAVAARRDALATWDDLDHGWRAARTAVALARLTGEPRDVQVAVRRAKTFRRSWLGRRTRSIRTYEPALLGR